MAARTGKRLGEYRRRRRFPETPEPAAAARPLRTATAPRFVVQLHHARRRHFDFRLEVRGTLRSWAIPKGPSHDPAAKRLAVEVEDHPLEYGDFEGEIPQGHYGAGTVAIWDRGRWEPEGDPDRALREGRLAFTLHGERLHGRWTLVRTGGKAAAASRQPNWLLIKSKDMWTQPGDVADDRPLNSTTEDFASHAKPVRPKPPRKRSKAATMPGPEDLQLARPVDAAPTGEDWLHEVKYDGYRVLARRRGRSVSLLSRNGLDWTLRLSHVASAVRRLDCRDAVLDGELVALDARGHSSFDRLQRQMSTAGRPEQTALFVFDLLYLDGEDLRNRPLDHRKRALARLLGDTGQGALRPADHIAGHGDEAFRAACAQGLEGIISKARDGAYRSGRSGEWLKVKCVASDEFAVIGYTAGKGTRGPIGALLLARPDGAQWRYAGRVGTGFDGDTLELLRTTLKLRKRPPALLNPPMRKTLDGATPVWVEPRTVIEVHHRGMTADGLLRQASLKGLRPDKSVADLREPTDARSPTAPSSAPVHLTHRDRSIFDTPRITKQQLADFYGDLAEPLLRGIRRRPISLMRCPDGVGGECFFQRHLTAGFPDAIHEATVPSARGGTRKVLYIENREGLIALVQMGVVEIHAWGATIDDIDRPDQIVLDLDPGPQVSWSRVVAAARSLRARMQGLGLDSFVRTSGGKGLHVVIPLLADAGWSTVKAFAQAVARAYAAEQPREFVAIAGERNRRNRIFIDYLRNSRSASSVASFSLRARPGAPAATPLSWDELGRVRSADQYGYANLRQRLRRLEADPWEGFEAVQRRQRLPDPGRMKQS